MYFIGCTGIYLMTAISIERQIYCFKIIRKISLIKNLFLRYYAINKPLYMKALTSKHKILSIVMCIVLGLIWPVLPLFGWSYYTLEGGLTSCTVEWSERSFNVISYNVVIWVGGFFVPLIIIFYTNFKLIYIVSLQFASFKSLNIHVIFCKIKIKNQPILINSQSSIKKRKREKKITMNMLFYISIFFYNFILIY